jgi:hypothetical protein
MTERMTDRVAGMLVHIVSAAQFPMVQDTTMEKDTTLDAWCLDDRAHDGSGRWNARSQPLFLLLNSQQSKMQPWRTI